MHTQLPKSSSLAPISWGAMIKLKYIYIYINALIVQIIYQHQLYSAMEFLLLFFFVMRNKKMLQNDIKETLNIKQNDIKPRRVQTRITFFIGKRN